jgi:hypothetical protein
MWRFVSSVLLLLGVLGVVTPSTAARPHVYLVLVDGLGSQSATASRMPKLFALLEGERERSSYFPVARPVMPTRTNANMTALMTGAFPEANGITGNAYWSRKVDAPPAKLDAAAAIEVETLFTALETTTPALVTMGVFAKPKLGRLLGEAPGRQHAPDTLWSAERLPPASRDAASGYASDDDTMNAALGPMADGAPDFAFIAMADVDRTAHRFGPDSPECERAIAGADAAIARLVDRLRSLDRWNESVLIVTADHGFQALAPSPERPYPVITFGRELLQAGVKGVRVVADGGVEHVYAEGVAADASTIGAATPTLARVAGLAAATPGVAEVLARLPVPGIKPLAATHPDWHVAHERTGELLLVAAPGYQFIDPWGPRGRGPPRQPRWPGRARRPPLRDRRLPRLDRRPQTDDHPQPRRRRPHDRNPTGCASSSTPRRYPGAS